MSRVRAFTPSVLALISSLAFPMLPLGTGPAQAFEIEPDEYIPAPAGTTALFNYFLYGDHLSYHPVGAPAATRGTGLTSTVGLARVTQFLDIGAVRALVEVLQPYGGLSDAHINGTNYPGSSGIGDTTLAIAFWPYRNDVTQTYIGIGTYVTLPDGQYNGAQAINLGSHRFAFDPQLAYHQGLGTHWSFGLTGDYIFYGDNKDAGPGLGTLSERGTLQLQAFLNYAWTKGIVSSLGYEGETGGQVYQANTPLATKTAFQEIRFVNSYAVTPSFQLLGELNHQFSNEGGFKQDFGVTLRALYTFSPASASGW